MKTRALLAAAALAGAAAPATADVLLQTDFEVGTPAAPWSANVQIAQAAGFTRFMGRYSETEGIAVTVAAPGALAPGESFRYTAEFDLYVLDSWDGFEVANGPDTFTVSVNNAPIFSEHLAQHEMRTYRAPDEGPSMMGFNPAYKDSIYRDIALTFGGQAGETMTLKWKGHVMQGMADESWGIDNVRISYEVVPAPGPVALLALGGVLMMRRRPRN